MLALVDFHGFFPLLWKSMGESNQYSSKYTVLCSTEETTWGRISVKNISISIIIHTGIIKIILYCFRLVLKLTLLFLHTLLFSSSFENMQHRYLPWCCIKIRYHDNTRQNKWWENGFQICIAFVIFYLPLTLKMQSRETPISKQGLSLSLLLWVCNLMIFMIESQHQSNWLLTRSFHV